jgi:hypothetical protein
MVWYGTFYMHQYNQSSRSQSIFDTHFCTCYTAYTDARKTYCTIPYHTSMYNRLPEDEPSGSKHVEDIKIKI